ncbi:hypothetical protein IWC96_04965 [Brevundimonas sp. BAL450]|uniref:hypothetical protein n=1 Tax=Brevundimonas sp. BAL450 TaxID=1708162 RepID=UPI0018C98B6D|nr:hypothetical protein [Brevundimonas sp. BAL450]MBG7614632.1 hypothetical protein [Brevundimonas sp. BAL450]
MTSRDPATCRRALQEIKEIAAVATLQDSQMSDQEALQTIAAIADWVTEEGAAERADCGDVIRRLNSLTASADLDSLDDREALDLFDQVLATLTRPADRQAHPTAG